MIGGRGLEVYDIANNQITGATFLDSDEKGPLPLHGGASGSGGPPGEQNGHYRHGERTKAAIAEQQKLSAWLKMLRAGLT